MIYFLQGAPGATGEQGELGLGGDPVSCIINNSNYWIILLFTEDFFPMLTRGSSEQIRLRLTGVGWMIFRLLIRIPFCSYFSYKRSSYYVIECVSPWVVQSSDCVRNIYRLYFGVSVLHDDRLDETLPRRRKPMLADTNLGCYPIHFRPLSSTIDYLSIETFNSFAFVPCGAVWREQWTITGKNIWLKCFAILHH